MAQLGLFGLPSLSYQETLPLNTPSSLLFYLAAKADWVSRSELAFLYRPDESEAEALKYLRLQLHRAQQYAWASSLEIKKNQLRWLIDTDIGSFQKAIEQKDWLHAIECYKDSFFGKHSFPDLATYSAWIDLERDVLEQSYRLALSKQIEVFELQTEFSQAAVLSARLLALDELDEEVMQQHLRHLALAGQKDTALKCFAAFSKLLKDELDSEPLDESLELIEQIRQDKVIEPKSARPIRHNLPGQSTRFIGRKRELLELSKQLSQSECRLLSLIGLGGSGKSRLSIELARGQLANFRDGVYFIELAALDSENAILSSLAQVLGLQFSPKEPPKVQLLNFLRDKQLLLVFDNFEHLLVQAALLSEMLAVSDRLKIVITSRESLKLKSEWLFDVEGLAIPEVSSVINEVDSLPDLSDNEAVSLFVSAAKRVQPQLEPSPEEFLSIAQIARQVEGLPLALELAASWLRIMPIARIAQELSQGYDLLETDLSDVPERHRNLKTILDKTWESLSEKKRETLAKLSVFVGGCTLEAAEAVTQTHFSILLALVNEALLRRLNTGRFDLHLLIRNFAADKHKALDIADTYQRHGHFYAEQLAAHSSPKAGKSALRLTDDTENCRDAWLYLATQHQLDLLELSLNGIDYLYSMAGRYHEGNQLYEKLLGILETQPPSTQRDRLMAGIINGQADRSLTLGYTEAATAQLHKSLALLAPLTGVEKQRAYVLSSFARLCWEQGNYAQAQSYLQSAYDTVNPLDDQRQIVNILHGLAIVLRDQGKLEEAYPVYQNVIKVYLSMAEYGNAALAYNNLAALELAMNKVNCARISVERGLALIKDTKADRARTYLKQSYAGIYFQSTDYLMAEKAFLEVLELAKKIQDKTIVCDVLKMLGHCQVKLGEPAKAIPYLQDSLRLAQDLQSSPRLLATLTIFAECFQTTIPERSDQILQIVLQHPTCRGDIRKQAEELSRQVPMSGRSLSLEAALELLMDIH
ncbi:MAG: hypothetical protein GFH24_608416n3 [Chloroflexi bacterium AL-N5]|nr:hypothetical protein [Chloroflexi bacterium AL-N5]